MAAMEMSEEIVYSGRIFNLKVHEVELPSGGRVKREVVEHPGSAAIIPLLDGEDVLLIKQFRPAAGRALLEIPAGTLLRGEDPEECAHRELLEETGYEAGSLKEILTYYTSPGYSSERMHIFLATDLTYRGSQPEADEEIETVKLRLSDIADMILKGEVEDAKTICGILSLKMTGGGGGGGR